MSVKTTRTMTRHFLAGAVLLTGVAAVGGASAAPTRKPKSAEKAAATVSSALFAQLKSDDPTEVRAALDDARLLGRGGSAAAPTIAGLLASGLPFPLAQAAIETLADLESPEAAAAIVPYTHHREVKVRRAAVRALAKTIGPAAGSLAVAALRSSLSDPDIQVRAGAATGLGALKAKAAVKDLFVALEHHIYEAAASIGQLGDAADCELLVSQLGKIPFDVMTSGLDPMLFRPASELGDDFKIGVIHRVRDLGSRDANHFLKSIQGRWPKSGGASVRRELDAAVMATLSSPGSDS
jgi:hypothetical protein